MSATKVETPEDKTLPHFINSPNPRDRTLLRWLIGVTLFGFILIPFKIVFVQHPLLDAIINGGLRSMVITGAEVKEKDAGWFIPFLAGSVTSVKFLPLFLLIGREWSSEGVNFFFHNSKHLQRNLHHLEHYAEKHATLLLLIASTPFIPIPVLLVAILLGAAGMSMKGFLLRIFPISLVIHAALIYLGYVYGEETLKMVNIINKYTLYLTFAVILLPACKPLLSKITVKFKQ